MMKVNKRSLFLFCFMGAVVPIASLNMTIADRTFRSSILGVVAF